MAGKCGSVSGIKMKRFSKEKINNEINGSGSTILC
jgi:hypothetical protein